jgi:phosphatidate cytidylyltransferase
VARIGSAAVLLGIVLGVLIVASQPGWEWTLYVMSGVALVLGLMEFHALGRQLGHPPAWWLLVPLAFGWLYRGLFPEAFVTFWLAAAVVVGLGVFVLVRDWRGALQRWALAVGGSLYLGYTLSFYMQLYFLHRPDPNHLGFGYVVAVWGAIWVGDTAAYALGTRFGRHRFFPAISPKKSVEGAVAGFLAAVLIFAPLSLLINLPWWHGLLLGALIAVFAQLGDLVESQMKRMAQLKDTGHLIPGHGGFLDRIDSLLLVAPVVFYYLQAFHLA